MIKAPAIVLTASLVLLVVLGMLPALRAYRAVRAEHALMRDRDRRADRIQEWLRRHPEKGSAQGLGDEAALIAFLQQTALRVGADLESLKPVFSSRGGGATTQARRLLAHLRSREQGMRAFLSSLEEASMPWRIEDIQITGDRGRGAGVAVRLALEKMGEEGVSPEEIERYLTQEGPVMKTSSSAVDPARTFFRPPAARPAAPQEKSALAAVSDGWRLVGILQGADSRAIIEDKKSRRVFSVRPGEAVAGATVGPIGADGVVFMMGDDALRLTFE